MKPVSSRFLFLFGVVFIFVFSGCEKEVHINLGSAPAKVVVQGAVENGLPPYVFLTSTIGFFSNVSLSTLQSSFLHGANITVSDGTKTITLKEYSFDTSGSNTFYVYTIDTADPSGGMLGEINKFYTLTITYNGVTYTSVTKIPNVKNVDTLWFDTPLYQNSKTPDSALQLFANYQDPDTMGNCVRYFTQRNQGQFFPVDIFNDQLVNGKLIDNIALFAGYDKAAKVNEDSLRYFYPGDTVTLKWSEIDKNVYTFWNSFEYANNALGNPFASPINLKTNISNGGLGIWAGYGSAYKTIVVPR